MDPPSPSSLLPLWITTIPPSLPLEPPERSIDPPVPKESPLLRVISPEYPVPSTSPVDNFIDPEFSTPLKEDTDAEPTDNEPLDPD